MMKRVVLVLGVAVTGCASTASSTFSGKTATEGELKYSVLKMADPYAKMGTGCTSPVDAVHTELVSSSPDIAWNEKGQMIRGEFVERWTLSFCGTEKPVHVRVRGLPSGQTLFSVESAPRR